MSDQTQVVTDWKVGEEAHYIAVEMTDRYGEPLHDRMIVELGRIVNWDGETIVLSDESGKVYFRPPKLVFREYGPAKKFTETENSYDWFSRR